MLSGFTLGGVRRSMLGLAASAAIVGGAMLVPATASAAVSCSLTGGQVDVVLSADGDQAIVRQEALADGGEILVSGSNHNFTILYPEAPCLDGATPADNSNTNRVVISETAGFGTIVNIDLSGGGFAPGSEDEAGTNDEMEIYLSYATLNSIDRGDTLRLQGTGSTDHWTLGADGINFNTNFNGDVDRDIIYTGPEAELESAEIALGGGPDLVTAEGGAGTGAESAAGFRFFGGENFDTLIGGAGGESLSGDGGADTLVGRGGSDTYLGGQGNDTIDGVTDSGGAPDTLNYGFAPAGVTVDLSQIPGPLATGSEGTDNVTGSFGTLAGSPHADVLKGDSEANTVRGQSGNDTLDGGPGNDFVYGAGGADLVRGGPGDDSLFGTGGSGPADPGDTVAYDTAPAGVVVDFAVGADGGGGSDGIAFFQNIIGSPFSDTITGDAGANTLTGGGGVDTVSGLAGADTLLLRDGLGDTGDCGADADSAVVDVSGLDSLIGCESVAFAIAPPSGNTANVVDPCPPLRTKLKRAKKKLKTAKRKGKPTKKKRKKVRKLKRRLRTAGC